MQQYASKLLFDHTMAENVVLQLANANGVSLSPTLTPTAVAAARALLATAKYRGPMSRPIWPSRSPCTR